MFTTSENDVTNNFPVNLVQFTLDFTHATSTSSDKEGFLAVRRAELAVLEDWDDELLGRYRD